MSTYIWLSFTKYLNDDVYIGVWSTKPMYVDNNNDWVGPRKLNNTHNNTAESNMKYLNGSGLKNILVTEYFYKKYYKDNKTLVKLKYKDFIKELDNTVKNTVIKFTFDTKKNLDFFITWYNSTNKTNLTFNDVFLKWKRFIENNELENTIK